jgi:hypothetical protein
MHEGRCATRKAALGRRGGLRPVYVGNVGAERRAYRGWCALKLRIKTLAVPGRRNEGVHSDDIGRVAQKGALPSLAWRSAPLNHVFGEPQLSDLEAQFEQLRIWVFDTEDRSFYLPIA